MSNPDASMQRGQARRLGAILLTTMMLGAALGGCARRGEAPVTLTGQDDDAFCKESGGPVGSSEYVACRKNRDVQNGNAAVRADKAQRGLADYMLNNNPVR